MRGKPTELMFPLRNSKKSRVGLIGVKNYSPMRLCAVLPVRTISVIQLIWRENDYYTACISDSQAKKALGNGFTVDMIAEIFKGLL